MSFKVHNVTNYNYSFDAIAGAIGRLQLWSGNTKVAEVGFVDDNVPVPKPTLYPNLAGADIFFKRSAFPAVVDLLRNEKPIHLTVNNQSPGFVFLGTTVEPVGEEEAAA